MGKIKNVLFLCSGNTCRSPFAEYYAKWLKKTKYKEELKNVEFDSAGLYHYYEKPQKGTEEYLKTKGIDLSDFKAKEVDEDLIKKQDLILGFEEKWHVRKLKRRFKNMKDLDKKVHLLLKFAGETKDLEIEDPFHLPNDKYIEILKRVERGVEKAIERIIELNNNEN
ncbi:MAG: arsenate reductase/protein-tyrosine-phosphatase family protein [Promethearchaeota archaeon]